jgi:hypothetical protein
MHKIWFRHGRQKTVGLIYDNRQLPLADCCCLQTQAFVSYFIITVVGEMGFTHSTVATGALNAIPLDSRCSATFIPRCVH